MYRIGFNVYVYMYLTNVFNESVLTDVCTQWIYVAESFQSVHVHVFKECDQRYRLIEVCVQWIYVTKLIRCEYVHVSNECDKRYCLTNVCV